MTGLLAALDITNAATDTQVYVVPSSKTASFSVCVTNRSASTVLIRLALTTAASIASGQYIAFDVPVYANEVLERSGLVLSAGQFLYVRSSATSVNAVVWGYEE